MDQYFKNADSENGGVSLNPGVGDSFYNIATNRTRGLFGPVGFQAKDVTDGLSKTLAVSECVLPTRSGTTPPTGFTSTNASDDFATLNNFATNATRFGFTTDSPSNCWSVWQGDRFSATSSLQVIVTFRGLGHNYMTPRPGSNGFNTILPPNGPVCHGQTRSIIAPPRSYHRGGVYCVMADGAVRFVSQNIDCGDRTVAEKSLVTDGASPYGVWGALGTRASEEPIGNDF